MWMSDKPLPQVNNILFILIKRMYKSIHLIQGTFYFRIIFLNFIQIIVKLNNYSNKYIIIKIFNIYIYIFGYYLLDKYSVITSVLNSYTKVDHVI